MKNLPDWRLTNPYPAFYDSESGSSIEQTAKVYKAMQELINEHNKFVEYIMKEITNFESGVIKDIDEFKKCITTLCENYIKTIDAKILQQDKHIETLVPEKVNEITPKIIKEFIETGKIQVVGNYDELTESLEIDLIMKEGE